MATYIENDLNFTENSTVEYTLCLWGTKRTKVFIGMSQNSQHFGKYTFLDENKKDTIFGNGCRFNTIYQAIDYIKSDIKSRINKGESPCELIIDGRMCFAFTKISDESL